MGQIEPVRDYSLETTVYESRQKGRQTEIMSSAANGIDTIVRNLGSDPFRLMARHQLLPDERGLRRSSIPLKQYTALLEEAADLTGEDHFGLLFGREFSMTELGPNGYLLVHSPTVGEALARFADHFADLQEGSHVRLDLCGDLVRVSYRIDDPRVKLRRQDAEFTIMTIHNFFRSIFGRKWQLDRVDFTHAPVSNQRQHNQLLETAVEFRKTHNAIYLQRSLLDLELPSHDPFLLRHLEDYFRERQASLDARHRLTKRISLYVELELEKGGEPRLGDVAEAVGMSVRSMHRRLAEEGASFRNILLDCRLNAAKEMLRDTDIPLIELGIEMGYSDATAFSRAFRKKIGISPQAWRNQCRAD